MIDPSSAGLVDCARVQKQIRVGVLREPGQHRAHHREIIDQPATCETAHTECRSAHAAETATATPATRGLVSRDEPRRRRCMQWLPVRLSRPIERIDRDTRHSYRENDALAFADDAQRALQMSAERTLSHQTRERRHRSCWHCGPQLAQERGCMVTILSVGSWQTRYHLFDLDLFE